MVLLGEGTLLYVETHCRVGASALHVQLVLPPRSMPLLLVILSFHLPPIATYSFLTNKKKKDELTWYETKDKSKQLGRLSLADVFAVEPIQLFDVGLWMANSCYFVIKTKPGAHNRTYYLATEKPDERQAWLAALNAAKRSTESRTQVEEQALTGAHRNH